MAEGRDARPMGGWRALRVLARGYRPRIALLGTVSFIGAMLEAGFLVLLTSTVLALAAGHEAIGPWAGQSIPISTALWVAAALVVVRLALSLVAVHVSAALGAEVRTEQRLRVARAYLRADWAVQQGEPSGKLQELLVSFVGRINQAMSALTQAITSSLSLIAFLAAGVLVDPLSTIAVLGALAGLGLVLAPVRRAVRRQAKVSMNNDITFATVVAETGGLGLEMQVFGVRDRFESRLADVIALSTENQRRVQILGGILSPVYTFLAYGAVIIGVGLLQSLGVGDLASFGAIMLLMLRSLSYGQQLIAVSGSLASSIPSLERVDDTVAHYASRPSDDGATAPASATPLTFRSVTFSYSAERTALADVSLDIRPGEMVGVIGPSGAGKSTLAQLILGLRRPTLGAIDISGVDLREVSRGWWTRQVAFVPQEPVLFTGTVAENIRFFRDGIDDEELRRAARSANVLDDIEALPLGFNTHLGERGSQLSGGQRQRVSIARALVGDPELLVLDEPTSALDGQSEALIRDTLGSLHGDVAVVIIAHRMSTLDLCDRIAVIEDGRVTAFDTPQNLLASSDFYRTALAVAGGE